jgi:hypothetical protein
MDVTEELLHLDAEDEYEVTDLFRGEYLEPIIANTKTAVVTGTPRFYAVQRDRDGRAG